MTEIILPHLELQYQYAKQAVRINNIPLSQALLEYTSFWKIIKNKDWDYDPNTEIWQSYCSQIQTQDENPALLAYKLATEEVEEKNNHPTESCFWFDYRIEDNDHDKEVVRIHFGNNDRSGFSPLSIKRYDIRQQELKQLFSYVQTKHPQAQLVKGGSWLYNLSSYRRLFPQSYTQDMEVQLPPVPRNLGLWGQFLDKNGLLKTDQADEFLAKANLAQTKEQLLDSFKFKYLKPKCQIEDFYHHLNL